MPTILQHQRGHVLVKEHDGKRTVTAESVLGPGLYAHEGTVETAYPLPLIEAILAVKGPEYFVDEIRRDIDPGYVQKGLLSSLFAYAAPESFAGKRLLDFGSGSGSSTMILARTFPGTEIVGVELLEEHLRIAEMRAAYYGHQNVRFLRSPFADSLPPGIGTFDYIVLSAVYEHLLPAERPVILRLLWDHLKPGGVLFINETPYRWALVETHTTQLPLINYLPAWLALPLARRFSRSKGGYPGESWESLLRRGVRGGSPSELKRHLPGCRFLPPSEIGCKDRIDLWLHNTPPRWMALKKVVYRALKVFKAVTGITMLADLKMAVAKPTGNSRSR